MSDLPSILTDNRQAVADFVATARAVPATDWTRSPAPGKWSPGQVTEHVTLAYELSRRILQGNPPPGAAPKFLRPVIRHFFLGPVLKNGRFGKGGKSPKPFQPSASPADPTTLVPRLEAAAAAFASDVDAAVNSGQATLEHPFFGRVPLTDYLQLQVIHTRHHRQQLPGR